MLFPILTVKGCNRFGCGLCFQTVEVDINPVGIRAGRIEGFNPADLTEGVFGNPRSKLIGGQLIGS